jgi:hypothetical protein
MPTEYIIEHRSYGVIYGTGIYRYTNPATRPSPPPHRLHPVGAGLKPAQEGA